MKQIYYQFISSTYLIRFTTMTKIFQKYFQKRFALSEKGAKDLQRGIFFSTLLNLALMLPPT